MKRIVLLSLVAVFALVSGGCNRPSSVEPELEWRCKDATAAERQARTWSQKLQAKVVVENDTLSIGVFEKVAIFDSSLVVVGTRLEPFPSEKWGKNLIVWYKIENVGGSGESHKIEKQLYRPTRYTVRYLVDFFKPQFGLHVKVTTYVTWAEDGAPCTGTAIVGEDIILLP